MRLVALFSIFPILALEACKGCASATDTGKPEGTDDPVLEDTSDHGAWLSMRATQDGKPAIAYYDRTNDALGFAIGTVSADKVTWASERVDSYPDDAGLNPGDAGKYAAMVVAGDGSIWVSYQDTNQGTAKYAHRTGTNVWEVGVADVGGGSSSDAGYWTSIALDASGNPLIAHYDQGKVSLRVARWNGSSFTGEVVYEGEDYIPADSADTADVAQPGAAGEYAKLLVAGGKEYIAFYDRGWGALRLATNSGSGWSVEIVDNNGNTGQWPDLVMNGDKLAIAYHDVLTEDLRLAVGTPGNFDLETVDAGDHVGADTNIWLDGNGYGIAYFDGANNDMKVATGSPGSWKIGTVGTTGAAVGFHNESVELGGTRYVASYDYTNRNVWFEALE